MHSTQTMRLQVAIGVLHQCVEKELNKAELVITDWKISPFSIKRKILRRLDYIKFGEMLKVERLIIHGHCF